MAKFNDWSAFSEGEGKPCLYGGIKPKKSEGDYSKKGVMYLQLLPIFQVI